MTNTLTTAPGVCDDCGGHCQPQHAFCAKCRRLRKAAQAAEAKPEPTPLSIPHAGSPYRCRDHHDIAVDRRGRGCPWCGAGR